MHRPYASLIGGGFSSVKACLSACILLFAAFSHAAPDAQTPARKIPLQISEQSPDSLEELKRIQAIIEWCSGAWSFISGVRSGVAFLTGLDGQSRLTIADIRQTVTEALRQESLTRLQEDINGFLDRYDQTQILARNQVIAGQSLETLMSSPWGKTHLYDRLRSLVDDGSDILQRLEPILRAPANPENDRRVVAIMPAYTVMLPSLISAMKLAAEIDPTLLKRGYDEVISKKLVMAEQSLFMAAGAYVLYAYEPARGPVFFYSPVGTDRDGWMLERPLYRYHYVDPFLGGRFAGPHAPFYQYQAIPIVQLALDSLDKIMNVQPSMVTAKNVFIWDLFNTASSTRSKLGIAPFVFGYIVQVRQ